ncbi:MAG: glycoside hydrolase [Candidatus Marinimicrobia bacterium]|nr:glycoside hydrolase [Candidatus Neomarinimicrobiota bacterium]
MLSQSELESLRDRAIKILRDNYLGNATKPAPHLYPHQWNWDSAFIAIGLSHVDEKRAQAEILSLLRGQWSDGMVPHIIFDTHYVNYHPGPAYWNCSTSPESPKDVQTSGITQPPILSYAAYQIFQNSKDKEKAVEFLGSVFPNLKKYHRFFFNQRDPTGEGLTYIIHPWESGLDNSPRWDEVMESIKMEWIPKYERVDTSLLPTDQRPTDQEYDRYTYLVELFQKSRYNQDVIRVKNPFVIQPVLFNSLMYTSLHSLEQIGHILGENVLEIKKWRLKTKNAINTKLWDEDREMYYDYDLKNERRIVKNTISNFVSLFAGLPSLKQAKSIIRVLTSPTEYWPENGYPLCSVSMSEPEFNPVNYWRGPVWINMNWLMIKGLENYGYHNEAKELATKTLELVLENGFYEYFDPFTGKGCGTNHFSWSASLTIDLIETYRS